MANIEKVNLNIFFGPTLYASFIYTYHTNLRDLFGSKTGNPKTPNTKNNSNTNLPQPSTLNQITRIMPSSKPFHNLVTIIAIAIASLHCIGVVHAQAGGGGFDPNQFGGGNNKMCPPKHCGKGYTAVPKSTSKSGDDNDTNALSFESRGCNSLAGGGVSMGGMGMGGMGGVDDVIAPCCDLYHACLQICGSTKSFCDSNLEVSENMYLLYLYVCVCTVFTVSHLPHISLTYITHIIYIHDCVRNAWMGNAHHFHQATESLNVKRT